MARRFGRGFSKRKAESLKNINYKNTELLLRFITERGKILPRRFSGVSAKDQRALSRAIRRARNLGMLPFVGE